MTHKRGRIQQHPGRRGKLPGSKVREEEVWKRLGLERCQGWTPNGPPQ